MSYPFKDFVYRFNVSLYPFNVFRIPIMIFLKPFNVSLDPFVDFVKPFSAFGFPFKWKRETVLMLVLTIRRPFTICLFSPV